MSLFLKLILLILVFFFFAFIYRARMNCSHNFSISCAIMYLCMFLGMALNCIRWWCFSNRALGSAASHLLQLLKGSLQIGVQVPLRVSSIDQIDKFGNYFYEIGIHETRQLYTKKKKKEYNLWGRTLIATCIVSSEKQFKSKVRFY